MSITVNNPTPDCTNAQTQDITITNNGTTLETIIFVNLLAGMEWSDDGGVTWNSGGNSFSLNHRNLNMFSGTMVWDDINTKACNSDTNQALGEWNFEESNFNNFVITGSCDKNHSNSSFIVSVLNSAKNNRIWLEMENTTSGRNVNLRQMVDSIDTIIATSIFSYTDNIRFYWKLEVINGTAYAYFGSTPSLTLDSNINGIVINSGAYSDISKIWVTAPPVGCIYETEMFVPTESEPNKIFNFGWDNPNFINTIVTIDITTKPYKLRHNPEYISTNGEAYIEFQGSNTLQVTPTIDSPDTDLTNGQQKELVLQSRVSGESATYEIATLVNHLAGVEYSEDSGSTWDTGNSTFEIQHFLDPDSVYYVDSSGGITTTAGSPFIKVGTTDTIGDLTVDVEDLAAHPFSPEAIGIIDTATEEAFIPTATSTINEADEQELYAPEATADIEYIYANPEAIPTDYIAYWNANNSANDATGNYNGTLLGNTTYGTDRNDTANSAFVFDGADDCVKFNNLAITSDNKISIAAWVYLDSTYTGDPQIFRRGNGLSAVLDCRVVSGKLYIEIGNHNGGSYFGKSSPNNITTNEWNHVGFTYDGDTGELIIYENGKIVFNETQTTLTNFIASEVAYDAIGAWWQSDVNISEEWKGKIDDVRIYTDILTPGEFVKLAEVEPNIIDTVFQPDATGTIENI